jgi:hypothetical protein
MKIPTFYLINPLTYAVEAAQTKHRHSHYEHRVFAESGEHHFHEWITLGFVSPQSPFGQGIFMGFNRKHLLPATPGEVIACLLAPHPHGTDFVPVDIKRTENTDIYPTTEDVDAYRDLCQRQIKAIINSFAPPYQDCWKMLKAAEAKVAIAPNGGLDISVPPTNIAGAGH